MNKVYNSQNDIASEMKEFQNDIASEMKELLNKIESSRVNI